MKKYEKDGKIGVLVSRGYGAGWSSWNSEYSDVLTMDYDIVKCIEDGDVVGAIKVAKSKCGDFYEGGADDLEIEWLDRGTIFEIEEYDGSESLHIIGTRSYLQA